jgi:hypothetical protein
LLVDVEIVQELKLLLCELLAALSHLGVDLLDLVQFSQHLLRLLLPREDRLRRDGLDGGLISGDGLLGLALRLPFLQEASCLGSALDGIMEGLLG